VAQHLLLVDDNSLLLRFMSQLLGGEFPQAEIRPVETCAEARAAAKGWEPGVVLLDRMLPDGDGLVLLRELKTRFPAMLALVITGEMEEATPEDVREVILKPFDADDLVSSVQGALEARYCSAKELGPSSSQSHSLHAIRNQLSSLMAGIRAFQGDVVENAGDAEALCEIAKRYGDRLVLLVQETSEWVDQAGVIEGTTDISRRKLSE